MKKALVIALALVAVYAISNASIILPFWQDDVTGVYSMFIVFNTGTTSALCDIMFYSDTNAPQAGNAIERTIQGKNIQIFGTGRSPFELTQPTSAPYGHALLTTDEGGNLLAVGIIYDGPAKSGYPIPCFPGGADGTASSGW